MISQHKKVNKLNNEIHKKKKNNNILDKLLQICLMHWLC